MSGQVSLIDGHIDNADRCVCCGRVIPEGSQYCVICGNTEPKDMVEVVRCKDCKHSDFYIDRYRCENRAAPWFNDEYANVMHPNDFCSYGERKAR